MRRSQNFDTNPKNSNNNNSYYSGGNYCQNYAPDMSSNNSTSTSTTVNNIMGHETRCTQQRRNLIGGEERVDENVGNLADNFWEHNVHRPNLPILPTGQELVNMLGEDDEEVVGGELDWNPIYRSDDEKRRETRIKMERMRIRNHVFEQRQMKEHRDRVSHIRGVKLVKPSKKFVSNLNKLMHIKDAKKDDNENDDNDDHNSAVSSNRKMYNKMQEQQLHTHLLYQPNQNLPEQEQQQRQEVSLPHILHYGTTHPNSLYSINSQQKQQQQQQQQSPQLLMKQIKLQVQPPQQLLNKSANIDNDESSDVSDDTQQPSYLLQEQLKQQLFVANNNINNNTESSDHSNITSSISQTQEHMILKKKYQNIELQPPKQLLVESESSEGEQSYDAFDISVPSRGQQLHQSQQQQLFLQHHQQQQPQMLSQHQELLLQQNERVELQPLKHLLLKNKSYDDDGRFKESDANAVPPQILEPHQLFFENINNNNNNEVKFGTKGDNAVGYDEQQQQLILTSNKGCNIINSQQITEEDKSEGIRYVNSLLDNSLLRNNSVKSPRCSSSSNSSISSTTSSTNSSTNSSTSSTDSSSFSSNKSNKKRQTKNYNNNNSSGSSSSRSFKSAINTPNDNSSDSDHYRRASSQSVQSNCSERARRLSLNKNDSVEAIINFELPRLRLLPEKVYDSDYDREHNIDMNINSLKNSEINVNKNMSNSSASSLSPSATSTSKSSSDETDGGENSFRNKKHKILKKRQTKARTAKQIHINNNNSNNNDNQDDNGQTWQEPKDALERLGIKGEQHPILQTTTYKNNEKHQYSRLSNDSNNGTLSGNETTSSRWHRGIGGPSSPRCGLENLDLDLRVSSTKDSSTENDSSDVSMKSCSHNSFKKKGTRNMNTLGTEGGADICDSHSIKKPLSSIATPLSPHIISNTADAFPSLSSTSSSSTSSAALDKFVEHSSNSLKGVTATVESSHAQEEIQSQRSPASPVVTRLQVDDSSLPETQLGEPSVTSTSQSPQAQTMTMDITCSRNVRNTHSSTESTILLNNMPDEQLRNYDEILAKRHTEDSMTCSRRPIFERFMYLKLSEGTTRLFEEPDRNAHMPSSEAYRQEEEYLMQMDSNMVFDNEGYAQTVKELSELQEKVNEITKDGREADAEILELITIKINDLNNYHIKANAIKEHLERQQQQLEELQSSRNNLPLQPIRGMHALSNDTASTCSFSKLNLPADELERYLHEIEEITRVPTLCRPTKEDKVTLSHFRTIRSLGDGAYGRVFLVQKRGGNDHNKLYAMKVLKKESVCFKRKTAEHAATERLVLELVGNEHPYLVSMHYAFQTDSKLYMVLDYVPGGELFSYLFNASRFEEDLVRLYIAQVVLALEHLHKLGVAYRDIKLENILLDHKGHIVITDYGLSKIFKPGGFERTDSFCGTLEYMAPEILNASQYGHDMSVDWWSVGVLAYELLTGASPFAATNPSQANQAEISRKINEWSSSKIPENYSEDARSFIARMLDKDPVTRLGGSGRGANEIKEHPFFNGIDWYELCRQRRGSQRSYSGSPDDNNADVQDVEEYDDIPSDTESFRTQNYKLFRGFSYVAQKHMKTNNNDDQEKFFKYYVEYCNPPVVNPQVWPPNLLLGKMQSCGAFGELYMVYENTNPLLQYVTKVVPESVYRPSEVDALTSMNRDGHYAVVQFIKAFRKDNNIMILMEFLEGPELSRVAAGGLSVVLCHDIFSQICQGLAYIQRNNFVHGDIKPENIVYTDIHMINVKIVDFGNACYSSSKLFWHDEPRYTLEYAPPEALYDTRYAIYSLAFDIWSLGCTLYKLVVRHTPFLESCEDEPTKEELRNRIINKEFSKNNNLWLDTPRSFKNLIERCLIKDWRKRITLNEIFQHPWLQGIDDIEEELCDNQDSITAKLPLSSIANELCPASPTLSPTENYKETDNAFSHMHKLNVSEAEYIESPVSPNQIEMTEQGVTNENETFLQENVYDADMPASSTEYQFRSKLCSTTSNQNENNDEAAEEEENHSEHSYLSPLKMYDSSNDEHEKNDKPTENESLEYSESPLSPNQIEMTEQGVTNENETFLQENVYDADMPASSTEYQFRSKLCSTTSNQNENNDEAAEEEENQSEHSYLSPLKMYDSSNDEHEKNDKPTENESLVKYNSTPFNKSIAYEPISSPDEDDNGEEAEDNFAKAIVSPVRGLTLENVQYLDQLNDVANAELKIDQQKPITTVPDSNACGQQSTLGFVEYEDITMSEQDDLQETPDYAELKNEITHTEMKERAEPSPNIQSYREVTEKQRNDPFVTDNINNDNSDNSEEGNANSSYQTLMQNPVFENPMISNEKQTRKIEDVTNKMPEYGNNNYNLLPSEIITINEGNDIDQDNNSYQHDLRLKDKKAIEEAGRNEIKEEIDFETEEKCKNALIDQEILPEYHKSVSSHIKKKIEIDEPLIPNTLLESMQVQRRNNARKNYNIQAERLLCTVDLTSDDDSLSENTNLKNIEKSLLISNKISNIKLNKEEKDNKERILLMIDLTANSNESIETYSDNADLVVVPILNEIKEEANTDNKKFSNEDKEDFMKNMKKIVRFPSPVIIPSKSTNKYADNSLYCIFEDLSDDDTLNETPEAEKKMTEKHEFNNITQENFKKSSKEEVANESMETDSTEQRIESSKQEKSICAINMLTETEEFEKESFGNISNIFSEQVPTEENKAIEFDEISSAESESINDEEHKSCENYSDQNLDLSEDNSSQHELNRTFTISKTDELTEIERPVVETCLFEDITQEDEAMNLSNLKLQENIEENTQHLKNQELITQNNQIELVTTLKSQNTDLLPHHDESKNSCEVTTDLKCHENVSQEKNYDNKISAEIEQFIIEQEMSSESVNERHTKHNQKMSEPLLESIQTEQHEDMSVEQKSPASGHTSDISSQEINHVKPTDIDISCHDNLPEESEDFVADEEVFSVLSNKLYENLTYSDKSSTPLLRSSRSKLYENISNNLPEQNSAECVRPQELRGTMATDKNEENLSHLDISCQGLFAKAYNDNLTADSKSFIAEKIVCAVSSNETYKDKSSEPLCKNSLEEFHKDQRSPACTRFEEQEQTISVEFNDEGTPGLDILCQALSADVIDNVKAQSEEFIADEEASTVPSNEPDQITMHSPKLLEPVLESIHTKWHEDMLIEQKSPASVHTLDISSREINHEEPTDIDILCHNVSTEPSDENVTTESEEFITNEQDSSVLNNKPVGNFIQTEKPSTPLQISRPELHKDIPINLNVQKSAACAQSPVPADIMTAVINEEKPVDISNYDVFTEVHDDNLTAETEELIANEENSPVLSNEGDSDSPSTPLLQNSLLELHDDIFTTMIELNSAVCAHRQKLTEEKESELDISMSVSAEASDENVTAESEQYIADEEVSPVLSIELDQITTHSPKLLEPVPDKIHTKWHEDLSIEQKSPASVHTLDISSREINHEKPKNIDILCHNVSAEPFDENVTADSEEFITSALNSSVSSIQIDKSSTPPHDELSTNLTEKSSGARVHPRVLQGSMTEEKEAALDILCQAVSADASNENVTVESEPFIADEELPSVLSFTLDQKKSHSHKSVLEGISTESIELNSAEYAHRQELEGSMNEEKEAELEISYQRVSVEPSDENVTAESEQFIADAEVSELDQNTTHSHKFSEPIVEGISTESSEKKSLAISYEQIASEIDISNNAMSEDVILTAELEECMAHDENSTHNDKPSTPFLKNSRSELRENSQELAGTITEEVSCQVLSAEAFEDNISADLEEFITNEEISSVPDKISIHNNDPLCDEALQENCRETFERECHENTSTNSIELEEIEAEEITENTSSIFFDSLLDKHVEKAVESDEDDELEEISSHNEGLYVEPCPPTFSSQPTVSNEEVPDVTCRNLSFKDNDDNITVVQEHGGNNNNKNRQESLTLDNEISESLLKEVMQELESMDEALNDESEDIRIDNTMNTVSKQLTTGDERKISRSHNNIIDKETPVPLIANYSSITDNQPGVAKDKIIDIKMIQTEECVVEKEVSSEPIRSLVLNSEHEEESTLDDELLKEVMQELNSMEETDNEDIIVGTTMTAVTNQLKADNIISTEHNEERKNKALQVVRTTCNRSIDTVQAISAECKDQIVISDDELEENSTSNNLQKKVVQEVESMNVTIGEGFEEKNLSVERPKEKSSLRPRGHKLSSSTDLLIKSTSNILQRKEDAFSVEGRKITKSKSKIEGTMSLGRNSRIRDNKLENSVYVSSSTSVVETKKTEKAEEIKGSIKSSIYTGEASRRQSIYLQNKFDFKIENSLIEIDEEDFHSIELAESIAREIGILKTSSQEYALDYSRQTEQDEEFERKIEHLIESTSNDSPVHYKKTIKAINQDSRGKELKDDLPKISEIVDEPVTLKGKQEIHTKKIDKNVPGKIEKKSLTHDERLAISLMKLKKEVIAEISSGDSDLGSDISVTSLDLSDISSNISTSDEEDSIAIEELLKKQSAMKRSKNINEKKNERDPVKITCENKPTINKPILKDPVIITRENKPTINKPLLKDPVKIARENKPPINKTLIKDPVKLIHENKPTISADNRECEGTKAISKSPVHHYTLKIPPEGFEEEFSQEFISENFVQQSTENTPSKRNVDQSSIEDDTLQSFKISFEELDEELNSKDYEYTSGLKSSIHSFAFKEAKSTNNSSVNEFTYEICDEEYDEELDDDGNFNLATLSQNLPDSLRKELEEELKTMEKNNVTKVSKKIAVGKSPLRSDNQKNEKNIFTQSFEKNILNITNTSIVYPGIFSEKQRPLNIAPEKPIITNIEVLPRAQFCFKNKIKTPEINFPTIITNSPQKNEKIFNLLSPTIEKSSGMSIKTQTVEILPFDQQVVVNCDQLAIDPASKITIVPFAETSYEQYKSSKCTLKHIDGKNESMLTKEKILNKESMAFNDLSKHFQELNVFSPTKIFGQSKRDDPSIKDFSKIATEGRLEDAVRGRPRKNSNTSNRWNTFEQHWTQRTVPNIHSSSDSDSSSEQNNIETDDVDLPNEQLTNKLQETEQQPISILKKTVYNNVTSFGIGGGDLQKINKSVRFAEGTNFENTNKKTLSRKQLMKQELKKITREERQNVIAKNKLNTQIKDKTFHNSKLNIELESVTDPKEKIVNINENEPKIIADGTNSVESQKIRTLNALSPAVNRQNVAKVVDPRIKVFEKLISAKQREVAQNKNENAPSPIIEDDLMNLEDSLIFDYDDIPCCSKDIHLLSEINETKQKAGQEEIMTKKNSLQYAENIYITDVSRKLKSKENNQQTSNVATENVKYCIPKAGDNADRNVKDSYVKQLHNVESKSSPEHVKPIELMSGGKALTPVKDILQPPQENLNKSQPQIVTKEAKLTEHKMTETVQNKNSNKSLLDVSAIKVKSVHRIIEKIQQNQTHPISRSNYSVKEHIKWVITNLVRDVVNDLINAIPSITPAIGEKILLATAKFAAVHNRILEKKIYKCAVPYKCEGNEKIVKLLLPNLAIILTSSVRELEPNETSEDLILVHTVDPNVKAIMVDRAEKINIAALSLTDTNLNETFKKGYRTRDLDNNTSTPRNPNLREIIANAKIPATNAKQDKEAFVSNHHQKTVSDAGVQTANYPIKRVNLVDKLAEIEKKLQEQPLPSETSTPVVVTPLPPKTAVIKKQRVSKKTLASLSAVGTQPVEEGAHGISNMSSGAAQATPGLITARGAMETSTPLVNTAEKEDVPPMKLWPILEATSTKKSTLVMELNNKRLVIDPKTLLETDKLRSDKTLVLYSGGRIFDIPQEHRAFLLSRANLLVRRDELLMHILAQKEQQNKFDNDDFAANDEEEELPRPPEQLSRKEMRRKELEKIRLEKLQVELEKRLELELKRREEDLRKAEERRKREELKKEEQRRRKELKKQLELTKLEERRLRNEKRREDNRRREEMKEIESALKRSIRLTKRQEEERKRQMKIKNREKKKQKLVTTMNVQKSTKKRKKPPLTDNDENGPSVPKKRNMSITSLQHNEQKNNVESCLVAKKMPVEKENVCGLDENAIMGKILSTEIAEKNITVKPKAKIIKLTSKIMSAEQNNKAKSNIKKKKNIKKTPNDEYDQLAAINLEQVKAKLVTLPQPQKHSISRTKKCNRKNLNKKQQTTYTTKSNALNSSLKNLFGNEEYSEVGSDNIDLNSEVEERHHQVHMEVEFEELAYAMETPERRRKICRLQALYLKNNKSRSNYKPYKKIQVLQTCEENEYNSDDSCGAVDEFSGFKNFEIRCYQCFTDMNLRRITKRMALLKESVRFLFSKEELTTIAKMNTEPSLMPSIFDRIFELSRPLSPPPPITIDPNIINLTISEEDDDIEGDFDNNKNLSGSSNKSNKNVEPISIDLTQDNTTTLCVDLTETNEKGKKKRGRPKLATPKKTQQATKANRKKPIEEQAKKPKETKKNSLSSTCIIRKKRLNAAKKRRQEIELLAIQKVQQKRNAIQKAIGSVPNNTNINNINNSNNNDSVQTILHATKQNTLLNVNNNKNNINNNNNNKNNNDNNKSVQTISLSSKQNTLLKVNNNKNNNNKINIDVVDNESERPLSTISISSSSSQSSKLSNSPIDIINLDDSNDSTDLTRNDTISLDHSSKTTTSNKYLSNKTNNKSNKNIDVEKKAGSAVKRKQCRPEKLTLTISQHKLPLVISPLSSKHSTKKKTNLGLDDNSSSSSNHKNKMVSKPKVQTEKPEQPKSKNLAKTLSCNETQKRKVQSVLITNIVHLDKRQASIGLVSSSVIPKIKTLAQKKTLSANIQISSQNTNLIDNQLPTTSSKSAIIIHTENAINVKRGQKKARESTIRKANANDKGNGVEDDEDDEDVPILAYKRAKNVDIGEIKLCTQTAKRGRKRKS